ncbi:MAG TPA: hypothetical protein VJP59_01460 [Gemmatimonadota bacterium]|nr:hypothetical protein [Gemmatimonadota bacterium]
MHRSLRIFAAIMVILGVPGTTLGQEQEPEIRTLTITAFTIPLGQGEKFNEYVDTYIIPSAQADPNVLSFRFARHHYGGGKANAWFIAEYASLEGLYQSEEFQNNWYEEHFPEGTPEREAADKATQEDFLPFFSDHSDEIASVNMNRAK